MPYRISISPGEKLNYWELSGPLGAQDILGAMGEMTNHPDWRPDYNTIVFVTADADLSEFDFKGFQTAQRRLAEINREVRGDRRIRVAIVSGSEANEGIISLWRALSEMSDQLNIAYSMFPTEEDARAWIAG
jgi:hypothetical protein